VPVPQSVIDALAAHLKAYPDGQDGLVCAGPVNADHFADTAWRPAVRVTGLPKTVEARMGDTVAVVMAIYAHLLPDGDGDTCEAAEEFLSDAA
jgi:hypothetical protein